MTQITVYPRLYTTRRANAGGVLISKGDATVETLYELLVNRDENVNVDSWNYRQQVLETALRLFGDFRSWLADQRSNPGIVGYNDAFLDDTLQFIQTGRRDLCVQNWYELVAEGSDVSSAPEPSTTARSAGLQERRPTIEVIQDWCSQPRGIEDLVLSLQLLFGQSRLAPR